jgi:uncharacterized protein (TIGR02217 family)
MTVPVFPSLPGIAYPVKRTVQWSTVKGDALSGKRTRFALWTYPVYWYDLPFNFLRSDALTLEWQTLEGFINGVQGAYGLFAYSDPNDNAVTNQQFGQGDGVTTTFQLVRSLGGFTIPVFLINGTPTISVAGVVTASASISAYGVVTFASAPANGAALTWTGGYYMPCRFDDDTTDMSQFMRTIWELKSLKFSTEKLP